MEMIQVISSEMNIWHCCPNNVDAYVLNIISHFKHLEVKVYCYYNKFTKIDRWLLLWAVVLTALFLYLNTAYRQGLDVQATPDIWIYMELYNYFVVFDIWFFKYLQGWTWLFLFLCNLFIFFNWRNQDYRW